MTSDSGTTQKGPLAKSVALADQFLRSKETIYLDDLAKNLHLTRFRLVEILRGAGVLYQRKLQYKVGFESWFRIEWDWVEALHQYKPALKVTRIGTRGIYELVCDHEQGTLFPGDEKSPRKANRPKNRSDRARP